jgi:hypothetical protein
LCPPSRNIFIFTPGSNTIREKNNYYVQNLSRANVLRRTPKRMMGICSMQNTAQHKRAKGSMQNIIANPALGSTHRSQIQAGEGPAQVDLQYLQKLLD